MSLQSDRLLAATGIFPKSVSEADHRKALAAEARWTRRLKKWMDGGQVPLEYREPPKDLEQIFRDCANAMPASYVATLLAGINLTDADMTAGYSAGIAAARLWIKSNWPGLTVDTSAGPKIMPLSEDEAGQMAAVYQVIDQPDPVLLDELEQCSLEPRQADAFRAVYPDLYAWVSSTIQAIKAEHIAKDREWVPAPEIDQVMRIFLGMPPEIPFTPPVPPPVVPTKYKGEPEKFATQGDLTMTPVGRENAAG